MKVCTLCDKGSVTGGKRSFLRSHYNPTKTIRRYPNLQWAKLPSHPDGRGSFTAAGVRAKICTKCLKKLHK